MQFADTQSQNIGICSVTDVHKSKGLHISDFEKLSPHTLKILKYLTYKKNVGDCPDMIIKAALRCSPNFHHSPPTGKQMSSLQWRRKEKQSSGVLDRMPESRRPPGVEIWGWTLLNSAEVRLYRSRDEELNRKCCGLLNARYNLKREEGNTKLFYKGMYQACVISRSLYFLVKFCTLNYQNNRKITI